MRENNELKKIKDQYYCKKIITSSLKYSKSYAKKKIKCIQF